MTIPHLHDDEIPISALLAAALVADQFPQYASLPLRHVPSSGTVHVLFQLGDDLVVRLPRVRGNEPALRKELEWVPRLSASLPMRVSMPLALGQPTSEYPSEWLLSRWLDGGDLEVSSLLDQRRAARTLAEFVVALRTLDPADGPPPGDHNGWKGEPIERRHDGTVATMEQLNDDVDVHTLRGLWDEAIAAPEGPSTWIHGDLLSSNLLVRDGELDGVLDFGCLSVGDPSIDLLPAWVCFDARGRHAFRETVGADDAMWRRGRAWAINLGVTGLPYYRERNPGFAAMSRRTLDAVLAEAQER